MDTPSSILKVAKKLFLEKGYTNTTMREIACQANINLGLIPYHFKTKENIAKLIYDTMLIEYTEEINHDIKFIENPISKLAYVYIYVMEKILETDGFLTFYLGLLQENMIATDSQIWSRNLVREICSFYNDDISENHVLHICLISKGVEKALIQEKHKGTINTSYLEINKLIVSTMLSQMNIDKAEIEKHINNCIDKMKNANLIKLTLI